MKHLTTNLTHYLVILLFSTFTLVANGAEEVISKSYSVKSGGSLYIESDSGRIEIETWDKNIVDIKITKKSRKERKLGEFNLDIEHSGSDVSIEGEGEWNSRVSVTYYIRVPKEYDLDLKTGGGSISVNDISGQIKMKTSGGAIKIGNVAKGNVDVDTSGGSIKVGNVNGNLKADTSGGKIIVGKITGKTDLDTSGGRIEVTHSTGDLNAETSGGSITIGTSDSNVNVNTSGGRIKIGMAQGNVDANTSGGSITVEGSKGNIKIDSSGGNLFVGESGGYVKADTSGGNITIKKANGYIEADTSGGRIEAEMIQTDNSKDTHVSLDSSGGDVTLYIPKGIEATVNAKLKISHSARRDYRIYSDFPLTIKGQDSSRVSAKGKINGGGDKIDISTSNGDIYIKMIED